MSILWGGSVAVLDQPQARGKRLPRIWHAKTGRAPPGPVLIQPARAERAKIGLGAHRCGFPR